MLLSIIVSDFCFCLRGGDKVQRLGCDTRHKSVFRDLFFLCAIIGTTLLPEDVVLEGKGRLAGTLFFVRQHVEGSAASQMEVWGSHH